MSRSAVFVLLVALFGLVGCGGSGSSGGGPTSPADVVTAWSEAINAGDDDAAADLFADGARVIQGGSETTLAAHDDAVRFNASLPCGGEIVEQSLSGEDVTATFTLTQRPDHSCDGPGQSAVAVFRVEGGKITLWHQLPAQAAETQTA